MLVYTFDAKTEEQLANIIASYIRRYYKVLQIVVNPEAKNPYKVFLINMRRYNNIMQGTEFENDTDIRFIENKSKIQIDEEMINELSKNTYTIEIKIDNKIKKKLEPILYGNANRLLKVDGVEVYFSNVMFLKDKIILSNAYNSVTNKKIYLSEEAIKIAILFLIKEL